MENTSASIDAISERNCSSLGDRLNVRRGALPDGAARGAVGAPADLLLPVCGTKMRRNADHAPGLGKSSLCIVFPTKHCIQWIDPSPDSAHPHPSIQQL